MTPTLDPDWQTGCLFAAVLFLLFALFRGWINGPFRLLVKPFALLASWLLVRAFGGVITDLLARSTGWPVPQCALLSFCGLAFLGYQIFCLLGRAFFKRTRDCQEALTRAFFGVTGAVLGLLYGLFVMWVAVVVIRLLGHFAAEGAAYELANGSAPSSLAANIVRLQASVEAGLGKPLVDACDPVPRWLYRRLRGTERLVTNPVALRRFVTYPGFQKAWDDPKVRALEASPAIVQGFRRGDVWTVVTDPKLWDLLSSPDWWAIFSGPQFDAALRYALDGT